MTYVTITHRVEASSIQKATALREQCAEYLQDQDGCEVINSAVAKDSTTYTVIGVDLTSKRRFEEQVEAESPEDAEAQVVGKSKTRVVVTVTAV